MQPCCCILLIPSILPFPDKWRWAIWAKILEVHNIVQKVVIKTIPEKKKCKKAKGLSEEALQITEERREVNEKEGRKDIPN